MTLLSVDDDHVVDFQKQTCNIEYLITQPKQQQKVWSSYASRIMGCSYVAI